MDRRACVLGPAAFLAEHAPPLIVPADPPRGPVDHPSTGIAGLVGQEAAAELQVVPMGIAQAVRTVRLFHHGIGHRLGLLPKPVSCDIQP